MTITLTVNGTDHTVDCEPHESLRAVLRRLGFHSVRFGSHTGETGAADVLIDGTLTSADITLAVQAEGREIETVEGLAGPGELHPIQQAFIESGAIQSGYSTPAMVLAAKSSSRSTRIHPSNRSGTRCPESSTEKRDTSGRSTPWQGRLRRCREKSQTN